MLDTPSLRCSVALPKKAVADPLEDGSHPAPRDGCQLTVPRQLPMPRCKEAAAPLSPCSCAPSCQLWCPTEWVGHPTLPLAAPGHLARLLPNHTALVSVFLRSCCASNVTAFREHFGAKRSTAFTLHSFHCYFVKNLPCQPQRILFINLLQLFG